MSEEALDSKKYTLKVVFLIVFLWFADFPGGLMLLKVRAKKTILS